MLRFATFATKHRNFSFWSQKCRDLGLEKMSKDWGQIEKNLNSILRKGFSFAIVFEHDKIFEHNVNNFPRWELNSAGKHANLNLLIVFKLFSSESIRTERRPTCKTRQENIFGWTLQYKRYSKNIAILKHYDQYKNNAILKHYKHCKNIAILKHYKQYKTLQC